MIKSVPSHPSMTHNAPTASHSHPIHQLPSTECAQKQGTGNKSCCLLSCTLIPSLPQLVFHLTPRLSISLHIFSLQERRTTDIKQQATGFFAVKQAGHWPGSSGEPDLIGTVCTQPVQKNFFRKGRSLTGLSQKGLGTHQAHCKHNRLQLSKENV